MEHSLQHMVELVRALVTAGNRVRYPSSEDRVFWNVQGGPECILERPIDFTVARAVVGQPPGVEFVEDKDLIGCRLCWATISGPGRS